MPTAQNPAGAIEVFYSYSHRDEDLRDALEKHLAILKRQKVITDWHDRRIGAGNEWAGEIDTHLNTAHVILLLIRADFLASDYCYDVELKRAMERHEAKEARVIPVILRAVDWQGAPFGKLQALPKDAKPVTSWPDRDEAFLNVAQGIRAAVIASPPSSPGTAPVGPNQVPALPPIWNVLHNRNLNFTGREVLLPDLRTKLTSGQAAALTQAISGLGGVGKTQLAVEYAYRHAANYSLVWWVRAEEPATLAAEYAGLAEKLGLPEKDAADQRVVVAAVRHWLGQNAGWLLIFDNVGKPEDLRDYRPQGATGHVLITSRNPNWRGVASPLAVQVLGRTESVDFLCKRTGQADETAAAALAEALGDLPLALEQAGAYVEASGKLLSAYLRLFRNYQRDLLNRGTLSTDYPDTVSHDLAGVISGSAAGVACRCRIAEPVRLPGVRRYPPENPG